MAGLLSTQRLRLTIVVFMSGLLGLVSAQSENDTDNAKENAAMKSRAKNTACAALGVPDETEAIVLEAPGQLLLEDCTSRRLCGL